MLSNPDVSHKVAEAVLECKGDADSSRKIDEPKSAGKGQPMPPSAGVSSMPHSTHSAATFAHSASTSSYPHCLVHMHSHLSHEHQYLQRPLAQQPLSMPPLANIPLPGAWRPPPPPPIVMTFHRRPAPRLDQSMAFDPTLWRPSLVSVPPKPPPPPPPKRMLTSEEKATASAQRSRDSLLRQLNDLLRRRLDERCLQRLMRSAENAYRRKQVRSHDKLSPQ